MRIGVTLPTGHEVAAATAADAAGVPFVHVTAVSGAEAAVGAAVATATTATRILVGLHIGGENPVTLAEEIAVLDNLSNGRVGVIAEVGPLDDDSAAEDVALLRAALSGRPISHRGRRWQVPAGLPGHVAPPAVLVTPAPAQLVVPIWVAGAAANTVGRTLSIPVVAADPAEIDVSDVTAPGRCAIAGDLETDRRLIVEWAAAGTTHLLCALGGTATIAAIARWLIPEVGMVGFPRVIADAPLPAAWPRT